MPPSKGPAARVTLSAVAADAGVALSTASVILSENSVYFRNFSAETVRRVRKSAEKLGYRTNLFASALPGKGSSLFFALGLHDLHESDPERYHWGFDGDILGGVAEVALEARVYPIIALAKPHTPGEDAENLDRVIGGGVFGAIVRTPSAAIEKRLRQFIREGRPVVVVFPGTMTGWTTNTIDVDNVALGERAGALLASRGCRRWLILQDTGGFEPHDLRCRGFRVAARQHKARLQVVACPQSMTAAEASARALPVLRKFKADGVFALTSRTSDGVLHACGELGCTAGKDVMLVGCDCSFWTSQLLPRITSLEVSWRHVGQIAMRRLLEMRDNGESRCPRVLLDPLLIRGDTCPAGD
jgi:DNA-binding LacI/PurR family transcriptional regulator